MLVGWLDDHRNLPLLPRFVLHLLASTLLAVVVLHDLPGWSPMLRLLAGVGLVLATGWSINAHNFMDGIDGLLGMQMLFYFTALGAWHGRCRLRGVALACAGLAAAMPRLSVLQPSACTDFHGRCRQCGAGLAGGGPGCAAVAAGAAERCGRL